MSGYSIIGAAIDRDRANQWVRLLGLSKPLRELSSDTLIPIYDPETGTSKTVNQIKNDPNWLARGNADESGDTSGYLFAKLRDAEALSETNFILLDVPANDFELVAPWFRSKLPLNDGGGLGTTWSLRRGVTPYYAKPGRLADSNPDLEGNFPLMNTWWWMNFKVNRSAPWFRLWYRTFIKAEDPYLSFVDDQFENNTKVGRTGVATPTLEYPVGAAVLALIQPGYVVQWLRAA